MLKFIFEESDTKMLFYSILYLYLVEIHILNQFELVFNNLMTIFSGLVWPGQWRRCHTIWCLHGIILGSPGGCSTQMSNAIEKLTSNTGSKLTFNICHSFYCLKLIMCLESVTSHYFVTAFNMTTSRFWVQLTKIILEILHFRNDLNKS